MRSKVTIEITQSATVYGVFGLSTLDTLVQIPHRDGLPEYAVNIIEDFTILTINANSERFILINHHGLEIDAENSANWSSAEIEDGLPKVTLSSSELFIPQMLNLDILNGISFKKGCYTGQEIVARMHYLGKLKQRMFVCDINGDAGEFRIGDKVYADTELKKSIGNIVSIAEDGSQLLAVLRLGQMDQTLMLNQQTTLTVSSKQPYSFPE